MFRCWQHRVAKVFPGTYQIGATSPGGTRSTAASPKGCNPYAWNLQVNKDCAPQTTTTPSAFPRLVASPAKPTPQGDRFDCAERQHSPLPEAQIGMAKDASTTTATPHRAQRYGICPRMLDERASGSQSRSSPGGSTSIECRRAHTSRRRWIPPQRSAILWCSGVEMASNILPRNLYQMS